MLAPLLVSVLMLVLELVSRVVLQAHAQQQLEESGQFFLLLALLLLHLPARNGQQARELGASE